MRYRVNVPMAAKDMQGAYFLLVEDDVITVSAINGDIVMATLDDLHITLTSNDLKKLSKIPERIDNQ